MNITHETFKQITKKLFINWSALQLAVENGMGGRHGHKRAIDVMNYVYEYCIQNQNVTNSELVVVIEELMDQEFNTICEDDSISEIASDLLDYLQLCQKGEIATVETKLNKLPHKADWLDPSSQLKIVQNLENTSSDDDDDDDEDDKMDIDAVEPKSSQKSYEEEEAELGWTVVKNKNNRR